jgi:hypothetical protein
MATKKTPGKGKLAASLIFKKEWIFDPAPPWLKLNRDARTRINQLKTQFTKEVNKVIVRGQQ